MQLRYLIAFALMCLSVPAFSETIGDLQRRLNSKPLNEIAESLNSGTISWPPLNGDSVEERQFARAFLSKCESEYASPSQDSGEQTLKTYTSLTRFLARRGGYLNTILIDSLYRMSLTNIAKLAIGGSVQASRATMLLELMNPGPWASSNVGGLLVLETGNRRFANDLAHWPEAEILARISEILNSGQPVSSELTKNISSGVLIDHHDPVSLIYRVANTEMFYRYTLPGMLKFMALGGKLADLSDNDISEFSRLMTGERLKFGFPLFGIKMLRAVDLLAAEKEFLDPQPMFLKVAFD